ARLAEAEAERAERAAAVESTANALRVLLHIDGEGPLAFEESLTELPDRDQALLSATLDYAFQSRDELRALELATRASERQASAVNGGAWPTLSIAGGIDYANPNPLFTPPIEEFRTSYTVSGILSWSPDRAWAASRRGNAAEAQVVSAREREASLRDSIRTEVVDAKARYRASFEIYAAAVRQTAAAEEAYAARKKGYEVGLFDATSLIDSELDARRARLALIDAGANVRVRRYTLARALGEHLWEKLS
ncbi:MAG: TolC family protein, partial [Myxococcota bacterium]